MKLVKLSQGLFAIVDLADYHWINQWKWHASHGSRKTKWYACRREKGQKFWMHKEIWRHHHPDLDGVPKGMVIDHVNHFSLDNRFTVDGKLQLECITQNENMLRSKGWKKKGQKCKPPTQSNQISHLAVSSECSSMNMARLGVWPGF